MKDLRFALVFSAFVFSCLVSRADRYPKNHDIDVLHYQFKLNLSDRNDSIHGEAELQLKFKKDNLEQIRLDLASVSTGLQGKGMAVISVSSEGKSLSFSHRSNELVITIPKSTANQQLTVLIKYKGVPDAGLLIKLNRYNDRTFFSDNWPDLGHHWLPLVDHPYDKATCEFIVTAPAHYQVVSNGLLVEQSLLNDGNKLTHWKQAVPIAPWLFVLGVADFAVQNIDSYEGKQIQTWVYRQDREAGFFDFKEPSKKVLSFFSDYVGPFAYEKLANIQSNNSTGGMEAASAIMYSERSVTGKRDDRWQKVIIHEIAHQWFGDAVTESDWDDVWLSEGFATYFTMLFIEHDRGSEAFVEELKSSRKQILNFLQKNPDSSVVHHQLDDMSKVTSTLTYQKGAWVLHMLRNLIGESNFRKGIQSYYRNHFNGNATTTDFRSEMESASGTDLKSFFDQWLYRGGIPKIKGEWVYDSNKKQLVVTLQQTQATLFSLPVEIAVGLEVNNQVINKISLNEQQTTYTFTYNKKPSSVSLDPHTMLLAEIDFKQK